MSHISILRIIQFKMDDIVAATRARMEQIDSMLSDSSGSSTTAGKASSSRIAINTNINTTGKLPPPGLSGEEEVEWWKAKIAVLSQPPDIAESKGSTFDQFSHKSAAKENSNVNNMYKSSK